jgi:chemotaxis protein MotB
MEEKQKTVIIKKVIKGHAGHHGGSWKVAYADFVTAMMAFFLLMWLLAMSPPEKKARLSLYFRDFSLFQQGGQSFMLEGGLKPLFEQRSNQYYESESHSASDNPGSGITRARLLSQINHRLESLKETVHDNLLVEATGKGIKIQIVDQKDSPIFPAGSPQFTEQGLKILRWVASSMRGIPNDLVIEGHTDASGTRNDQMTNWELSALRATAAKRELEASGIPSQQIVKVIGYAHTQPVIRKDPDDPRNRRISLLFLYKPLKKSDNPYGWVWKPVPTNK